MPITFILWLLLFISQAATQYLTPCSIATSCRPIVGTVNSTVYTSTATVYTTGTVTSSVTVTPSTTTTTTIRTWNRRLTTTFAPTTTVCTPSPSAAAGAVARMPNVPRTSQAQLEARADRPILGPDGSFLARKNEACDCDNDSDNNVYSSKEESLPASCTIITSVIAVRVGGQSAGSVSSSEVFPGMSLPIDGYLYVSSTALPPVNTEGPRSRSAVPSRSSVQYIPAWHWKGLGALYRSAICFVKSCKGSDTSILLCHLRCHCLMRHFYALMATT